MSESSDQSALVRAARLEQMGVHVRSKELADLAKQQSDFFVRGGNRAMRRARKKEKL